LKFTGAGSDRLFQIQSFQFTTNSTPTSVGKLHEDNLPKRFYLSQNYPNPFNPNTFISYQLATGSQVTIKVYDVLGREVTTLVNEKKPAGAHIINFDASGLASGVYLYAIREGNFYQSKKMILLK
jgi:hypothetical protein